MGDSYGKEQMITWLVIFKYVTVFHSLRQQLKPGMLFAPKLQWEKNRLHLQEAGDFFSGLGDTERYWDCTGNWEDVPWKSPSK